MSSEKYLLNGLLIGCFCLLFVLELIFPLRSRKYQLSKRLITNLYFAVFTFVLGAYLVKPLAISLVPHLLSGSFGLLPRIKVPAYGQFILGFLLMDLSFYYWHRLNHVSPFFRRFHKVHHIDPDLDVSTSFRFHFGEIIFSAGFRTLQVIILGVTPSIYSFYEFFFQLATMFQHSNFRLPLTVEKHLNLVFVTPRMHGIHHSMIRDEMNSNYSSIFRLWDDLHQTLRLNVFQKDITIGVAGYQKPEDNRLLNLWLLPFQKQVPSDYAAKNLFERRMENSISKGDLQA